jgi:hypothetical protein
MNIQEYFEACQQFDWFYDYSDDHRVYTRESANEKKLTDEAELDPIKKNIFNDWSKYMFSGESWRTVKAPKPILENYYASNEESTGN